MLRNVERCNQVRYGAHMRGHLKWRGSKRLTKVTIRRVAICSAVRNDAPVALLQTNTSDYSEDKRVALATAVVRARDAAGWTQKELAERAGVSTRRVASVEGAEEGVGRRVLEAIGRALPGWDEDTPRAVLEGSPAPPTPGSAPENQPLTPQLEPDDEGWTEADQELMDAIRKFAQKMGIERVTATLINALRDEWEREKAERDQADQSG